MHYIITSTIVSLLPFNHSHQSNLCSLWDRSRSPKNAKHCASGTTSTIFLYIYVCRRSVRVAGYRIVSKCFYAFLFRRPRGEKYRTAMLHSLSRSPTMLKHSSSIFKYLRTYVQAHVWYSAALCLPWAAMARRNSMPHGQYLHGSLVFQVSLRLVLPLKLL